MKKSIQPLSSRTITRVSLYYQFLIKKTDKKYISSKELADYLGITPAIVRKDLALFGQFGTPRVGYNIKNLCDALEHVLGLKKEWNVVIIGCGNLGSALMKYPGFKQHRFNIIAGFDVSEKIIGTKINNIEIYHINQLKEFAKNNKIDIAVVAVPENVAKQTIEYAINCGIKGILNFTPVVVTSQNSNVKILKIDLTIEFLKLAFIISKLYDHPKK